MKVSFPSDNNIETRKNFKQLDFLRVFRFIQKQNHMTFGHKIFSDGFLNNNFSFEQSLKRQNFNLVAGIDEVGRGPLAGPVVAACVVLPKKIDYSQFVDSKKLTPARRNKLSKIIKSYLSFGIGTVSERTIEEINILQASLLAMKLALSDLEKRHQIYPDFLLIDGKFKIDTIIPQQALIKGDSKSASIAAASIIAKVERDNYMISLDKQYPQYGFAQHKGYPTKAHKESIIKHGICPSHRTSFKGVKEYV